MLKRRFIQYIPLVVLFGFSTNSAAADPPPSSITAVCPTSVTCSATTCTPSSDGANTEDWVGSPYGGGTLTPESAGKTFNFVFGQVYNSHASCNYGTPTTHGVHIQIWVITSPAKQHAYSPATNIAQSKWDTGTCGPIYTRELNPLNCQFYITNKSP